jgi:Na+/H+ antiporter NhaD/arsenite permease-like protein
MDQAGLAGVGIATFAAVVFLLAYGLVIAEDVTGMRKSKPVLAAAAILWVAIALHAAGTGASAQVAAGIHQVFADWVELLLFLLAAMTYVNVLAERRVFDWLQVRLVRSGASYRGLFWITGLLAFGLSPVADNLTTALVMGSVVLAVGVGQPRFTVPALVNVVVAANAGGAFSPFGDITTLLVWQKGLVPFLGFFRLFVPAVATFAVPALLMQRALPPGRPAAATEVVRMKVGARRVILLFVLTIVATVAMRNWLGLPAAFGMMAGLGALQIFAYGLGRRHRADGRSFDVFAILATVEWDTLLFFYGVMMCVGALEAVGLLETLAHVSYGALGPTTANVLVGVFSAILDNIPLMVSVLSMRPEMSEGQWLLVTLTAGVGGSLLSVGSAAGVALMGRARGVYTFAAHVRWLPAVALGYAAGILVHLWLNRALF